MTIRTLAVAATALLTLSAHAGEEQFDVRRELSPSNLREILEADFAVFLAGDKTPEFAEVGRTETFSAVSISPGLFGGGRRHCLDAFQKAIRSLVDTAVAQGYDAVVNVRPAGEGATANDPATLKCTPGYKVTKVSISASLAMSPAALQRQASQEQKIQALPPRSPADGAIYVPIAPLMDAPEVRQFMAQGVSLHWGSQPPPYKFRYGPDDYSDQAELTSAGPEVACRAAAVNALRQAVDEAKERKYDALIKLRSHLDGQFVPMADTLECQVGRKSVSVTLQVTLAVKP